MFLKHKTFRKIAVAILIFFSINIFGLFAPGCKKSTFAEVIHYPSESVFPFGSVLKFDFGTATSPVADGYTKITPDSNYSSSVGYGWENSANISLTALDEDTGDSLKGDYISGNNVRTVGKDSTSYISYDCPTFVTDLPVGYYKVRLIQGSNTMDTCSGAYIEGNMDIIP